METVLNGRYRLGRQPLGQGGMGEVWPAIDELLKRQVAVKLIRLPGDENDVDRITRFNREAQLTAQLDHPGIPIVYDIGPHKDRPFLVMQRIYGTLVEDLVESSPLPLGWIAAIVAQTCCVLAAAHARSLVHRDIKPANLMLDRHGAVKVLDFGLAAILGDDKVSRITRTGEFLGTATYTAPEQILGEPVTARTDLYSLGCTLYDLLVGSPPFNSTSVHLVLEGHITQRPERPGLRRDGIPREIEELVLAMLEKDPAQRPADAGAVLEVLLPHAKDRPELPGIITTETTPTQVYAAITSPVTSEVILPERLTLTRSIEQRMSHADSLLHNGQSRAAAREFRSLARELTQRHGDEHGQVLTCWIGVVHADMALGETARALDLLEELRQLHGADHPELARLNPAEDLR